MVMMENRQKLVMIENPSHSHLYYVYVIIFYFIVSFSGCKKMLYVLLFHSTRIEKLIFMSTECYFIHFTQVSDS